MTASSAFSDEIPVSGLVELRRLGSSSIDRITATCAYQSTPPHASLFLIANTFGIAAWVECSLNKISFASLTHLRLAYTADSVDEMSTTVSQHKTTIPLPLENITHIALTFNSDVFIVASKSSIVLIHAHALASGAVKEIGRVSLPTPGDAVIDLKPNPYSKHPSLILILTQMGAVVILDTKSVAITHSTIASSPNKRATAIAWSPKGAQLCYANADRSIVRMDHDGNFRGESPPCPLPAGEESDLFAGKLVVGLLWVESPVITVMCGNEDRLISTIFLIWKTSTYRIVDPSPPFPTMITTKQIHVHHAKIPLWKHAPNLTVVATSSSMETLVLASVNNGETDVRYEVLTLDENTRALLPSQEDDFGAPEHIAVGMAVDLTSTTELPPIDPDDPRPVLPLPIVWLLTDYGELVAWHVYELQSVKARVEYPGMVTPIAFSESHVPLLAKMPPLPPSPTPAYPVSLLAKMPPLPPSPVRIPATSSAKHTDAAAQSSSKSQSNFGNSFISLSNKPSSNLSPLNQVMFKGSPALFPPADPESPSIFHNAPKSENSRVSTPVPLVGPQFSFASSSVGSTSLSGGANNMHLSQVPKAPAPAFSLLGTKLAKVQKPSTLQPEEEIHLHNETSNSDDDYVDAEEVANGHEKAAANQSTASEEGPPSRVRTVKRYVINKLGSSSQSKPLQHEGFQIPAFKSPEEAGVEQLQAMCSNMAGLLEALSSKRKDIASRMVNHVVVMDAWTDRRNDLDELQVAMGAWQSDVDKTLSRALVLKDELGRTRTKVESIKAIIHGMPGNFFGESTGPDELGPEQAETREKLMRALEHVRSQLHQLEEFASTHKSAGSKEKAAEVRDPPITLHGLHVSFSRMAEAINSRYESVNCLAQTLKSMNLNGKLDAPKTSDPAKGLEARSVFPLPNISFPKKVDPTQPPPLVIPGFAALQAQFQPQTTVAAASTHEMSPLRATLPKRAGWRCSYRNPRASPEPVQHTGQPETPATSAKVAPAITLPSTPSVLKTESALHLLKEPRQPTVSEMVSPGTYVPGLVEQNTPPRQMPKLSNVKSPRKSPRKSGGISTGHRKVRVRKGLWNLKSSADSKGGGRPSVTPAKDSQPLSPHSPFSAVISTPSPAVQESVETPERTSPSPTCTTPTPSAKIGQKLLADRDPETKAEELKEVSTQSPSLPPISTSIQDALPPLPLSATDAVSLSTTDAPSAPEAAASVPNTTEEAAPAVRETSSPSSSDGYEVVPAFDSMSAMTDSLVIVKSKLQSASNDSEMADDGPEDPSLAAPNTDPDTQMDAEMSANNPTIKTAFSQGGFATPSKSLGGFGFGNAASSSGSFGGFGAAASKPPAFGSSFTQASAGSFGGSFTQSSSPFAAKPSVFSAAPAGSASFGGPGSGFGASPTSPFNRGSSFSASPSSAFGQSKAFPVSNTASSFSSPSTRFGGSGSNAGFNQQPSAFGGKAANPGFGGASVPGNGPAFGRASAFGSSAVATNPGSSFSQGAAFGGAAGSGGGFGSFSAQAAGVPVQQRSSAFGSFSQQAVTQGTAGFGGQQAAAPQQAPPVAKSVFGFSGYRG